MLMNKQKMVQVYFALRHLVYELRKNFIKLVFSKNIIRVSLNNNHKKLLKHINEFGWGLIPHKQLLDNPNKLDPLIFRANELLQKKDEIQEIEKKITTTKKNFKVTITDLFDRDEMLNVITDSNMIEIVGDYLGTEPYLNHSDIWWDRHTGNEAKDSQTFHYDGEDPIMVKIFFYLTDVSEKDGPFTFIGKTNKFINKIGLIYHHGIHGISDSDLSSKKLSNVKKFVGESGDIIFADTNGFHKGGVISSNSPGRILFTLTFVSKWPTAEPPRDSLLPFISASELLSGGYRNYL